MSKGKILFQLSGSIACFKACQLLSQLVKDGVEVEVVATRSALAFVGEATLEGLTGRRVHTEIFASGEYMKHIQLIRWADLVLLCPASANTINKLAHGLADDLLSALFLAHDFKKPYLIAPAMNSQMLQHPATRKSIETLRGWGVTVLGTGDGSLACGEVGEGRLMEPEDLRTEVLRHLGGRAAKSLRILVTSGGTAEPIDGVRSVTNTSTGRTGAAIATAFATRGHDVTYLAAENAPTANTKTRRYRSFLDLQQELRTLLTQKSFDAVIHAAAVSDYAVHMVEVDGKVVPTGGKIDTGEKLSVHMSRNPKVVDELRGWSKNPQVCIVAFKLTNTDVAEERSNAVRKLLERARPDYVVHNDLSGITETRHASSIYESSGREIASLASKAELASTLVRLLEEK